MLLLSSTSVARAGGASSEALQSWPAPPRTLHAALATPWQQGQAMKSGLAAAALPLPASPSLVMVFTLRAGVQHAGVASLGLWAGCQMWRESAGPG